MASSPTETDTPFKDYYEVLNLHPQADAAMLDQAYWHLARIHNAAIASDSGAGERLDELNEAYSVLRSAALRREYDKVRDAVLGEGALPEPPQAEEPEPEPPPLTVMEKQRPRPREESTAESKAERPAAREEPKKKKRSRRPRIRVRRFRIPSWQGVGSALTILALGGAALANGADPALVAPLLILGVALAVVPLMREMPRLPQLPTPTLRLPSVRAPRMPERAHSPSVDPDTLRQSTEAMLARWRVGTEGVSEAESGLPSSSSEPAPEPQQGDDLADE